MSLRTWARSLSAADAAFDASRAWTARSTSLVSASRVFASLPLRPSPPFAASIAARMSDRRTRASANGSGVGVGAGVAVGDGDGDGEGDGDALATNGGLAPASPL